MTAAFLFIVVFKTLYLICKQKNNKRVIKPE
jgi:hypothetical protein